MAGNWSSDTSGSDTETGEESLLKFADDLDSEAVAEDDVLDMRNEIVVNAPPEAEVIVLSSDEPTSSESSSEEFSTSYESSSCSSSMIGEDGPFSSPLFNAQFNTMERGFFFRAQEEFTPSTSAASSTIGQEHSSVSVSAAEVPPQESTNSLHIPDVRNLIEQKLPTISELSPVQVTLSSNRQIIADFPDIADNAVKILTVKNSNGFGPGSEDALLNRKSLKNNQDSTANNALKRYQVSSIAEAIWRPDMRKAEVTQRRGKQLETVGSAGNPTFLEFYEALYLMARVKLRLLLPDLTPMTVLDAYNVLMRHPEDCELYSIYEYLMDSNAIVAPFKPLKREIAPSNCPPIAEAQVIPVRPASGDQTPGINRFPAYEKEDSDSDLEVLSCSMPASSKSTEIVLSYKQGLPYEGPEISFPKLEASMVSTSVPRIPEELLPQCRALSVELPNGKPDPRIPIVGGHVILQPHWFTTEGMEQLKQTDSRMATNERTRKRKRIAKLDPKSSPKKRFKDALYLDDNAVFPKCFLPQMNEDDRTPERYHRRWFPRWFDGVELGVHSLSIVDTLHKFTENGIPKIDSVNCWSEYKNVFAKIVKGSWNKGEDTSLYRGTTTPLMTGTKGNQTQLIFGELQLAQEVSESHDLRTLAAEGNHQNEPHLRERSSPKIVFDVYTDSMYSKTKPTVPDYRVVHLQASSVLKIKDLMKLSYEAGDATLLVAHVVHGKVRIRQAMMFSIPRYS